MNKRKYEHTEKYYKKKYGEYITKAFNLSKEVGRSSDLLTEKAHKEALKQGFSQKELVESAVYNVSRDVARALKTGLINARLETNKSIRIKDIQNMEWKEIHEKYGNAISNTYHDLLNTGHTIEEARTIISEYWFGSK